MGAGNDAARGGDSRAPLSCHRNASAEADMSPITISVLGLLAYEAWEHFTGQPSTNPV
jgi:hypothetical protein